MFNFLYITYQFSKYVNGAYEIALCKTFLMTTYVLSIVLAAVTIGYELPLYSVNEPFSSRATQEVCMILEGELATELYVAHVALSTSTAQGTSSSYTLR